LVAAGKADLAIQQIPELLAVPGITYVGPLPPDFQKITVSSAAIFAATSESDAARALLDFLFTPESAQVVKEKGHEPQPQG
jgi:molybdate transport system substrate-binding protein